MTSGGWDYGYAEGIGQMELQALWKKAEVAEKKTEAKPAARVDAEAEGKKQIERSEEMRKAKEELARVAAKPDRSWSAILGSIGAVPGRTWPAKLGCMSPGRKRDCN